MVKIFVSYSRVDSDTMKKFAELLGYGCDVWYDQAPSGIIGGEDWWKRIISEIEEREHFIYLLSKDSVDSEYCQKELEKAIELGKHIIPVMIRARTAIPEKVKHLQVVQAYSDHLTDGISRLYGAILKNGKVEIQSELTEANRKVDLRILQRFWDYIPSKYFLRQFDEEIYRGYIYSDTYYETIRAYERTIPLPENLIKNKQLKLFMDEFNEALMDLTTQIAVAFTGDGDNIYKSNYHYIMSGWSPEIKPYSENERDKNIIAAKKEEWDTAIKKYELAKTKYVKVIECINSFYPEFGFSEN